MAGFEFKMTWPELSRFLARYLGLDPTVYGKGRTDAYSLCDLIIRYEPELAPYVLQAVSEAY